MTIILWIAGLFDRFFIDWYWVGHTKAWIIPKTEGLQPYIPQKVLLRKWLILECKLIKGAFLWEKIQSPKEILIERDNVFRTNNVGDIYLNYCEYLKIKYNSNLSKEEILQFRRDLSKKVSKDIKYKPDADVIIKYLKSQNIKIALGTVSRRETIDIYINENIKNKCNLQEYFDFIITKDDVTLKKPNPEVYNKIIKKFKIDDLSKCVVIEDSLTGVLAAKNANLNVIAIYDKYSDKDREKINELADYNVANFKELMELLKNIN